MSQETSALQSLGCDEAGAGEGQAGAIACHFIAPSDREPTASLQMQPGSSPTRRSFAGAKWGRNTIAGNLGLGLMFSSTEFPNIILKSWLDIFIIFWNSLASPRNQPQGHAKPSSCLTSDIGAEGGWSQMIL